MDLKDLFKGKYLNKTIEVDGWIRNHRKQANFGFIDFSDGTDQEHLQIVYDNTISNFEDIQKMLVGCAIHAKGKVVKSSGNQEIELKAEEVTLLGDCPSDYP